MHSVVRGNSRSSQNAPHLAVLARRSFSHTRGIHEEPVLITEGKYESLMDSLDSLPRVLDDKYSLWVYRIIFRPAPLPACLLLQLDVYLF